MPLSPYRVLDLTDDRGQYAGFILAQLGADVICVEPSQGHRSRRLAPFIHDEEGENQSLFHCAYNRGKRSVVVDDSQLCDLATGSDVLIECGAMDVDLEALRAANPALITVSISAFGQAGPKSDWLATDLIVAAAGGVLAVTGDKDRPPVRIGHPQSWLVASSDAAAAASIALRERAHSGAGQHIDVSAQQSMISTTQFSMMNDLVGNKPPMRIAGGLEMAPFKMRFVYECLDGHVSVTYLFGSVVGPYSNRLFQWIQEDGFCDDSLGKKEWIGYALDVIEGRDSIDELAKATEAIEAWTRTKNKWDLVLEAMQRGVLIAPIATTRDLLDMDHLTEREYWEELQLPDEDATARIPGPLARLSRSPATVLGPPPLIGEHTTEILAEETRSPSLPAMPKASEGRKALEGLKVCDLFWALAGPGTTRTLADFGATVVRVESEERPELLRAASPFREGDGEFEGSLQYHSTNAGKHHLALNLGVPESREVLLDMVRWADIITESFTPRAMRSMGLSYELFKEINPEIIMVSSCLMGQTGSMSDYAGFGTAGAAFGGFYPITGWPDRLPAGPYTAYTDYVSPRITVAAILAAVEHRDRTGAGQYLDYSQTESALHMIAPLLLDDEINGRTAGRNGNRDLAMSPHAVVRCGNPEADTWIAIACETDQQWRTLAVLMGAESLSGLTEVERRQRAGELEDLLSAWTAGQDPQSLQELLQGKGVPAHHVQNSAEVVADPQLVLRHQFQSVPHQIYGNTFVEGPAYTMSRTPGAATWAGPTVGEHTHEVLTEFLGYDDDKFTELLLSGALK